MFNRIRKDIQAVLDRDPAARNKLEVILCYSGFHAVILHRLAHWFYNRGLRLTARLISQFSRFITGIEIHPAAKIGEGLFIDHGMGVVIGETAEIGSNVTIYQGATLGGTGKETGKRHPTIGNNVVISSGAKILGPFKVGDNSKIGANAVVLREVEPNCTVVGVPGKIVRKDNKRVASVRDEIDLDQVRLPDPITDQIKEIIQRIQTLEERIKELEGKCNHETL
ncbi:MAG: serine O-acetyltransferase [Clostridiales bacterium]|jgi:serine O-acetyltransferase|nr:serine O-acetyltransferase [Clostridiales bacterium]